MIKLTLDQYLGLYHDNPDATDAVRQAAESLLAQVVPFLQDAHDNGVEIHLNPKTQSFVSGTANGGFRPQDCPIGAPKSNHKTGHAVDIYDPLGELDKFATDEVLEKHGLYREHPDDTPGWLHLQDLPPKSGRRTFKP